MIYVPIFKNRETELRTIEVCQSLCGDSIIPYIEIIDEKYSRRRKETDCEVITISAIQKKLSGAKAFVEFFRFKNDEYAGDYDPDKVGLARELSANENEYFYRTLDLCNYEGLIPSISIKPGFKISFSDLDRLLKDMKARGRSVAVRVDISLVDDYLEYLKRVLENKDYLLVDIRERNLLSQEINLVEISDEPMEPTLILINSPRKAELQNGDFELDGWDTLISNEAINRYEKLGFAGFGDFAGYKDCLPRSGRVPYGYALALMYCVKENKFWSVRNDNSKDGNGGYRKVRRIVLEHEDFLNPDKECLAYKHIRSFEVGGYKEWIRVGMVRYISQIYSYIYEK